MLVIGKVLEGFLRIIDVGIAIGIVVIMMVGDIGHMVRHMLGHHLHAFAAGTRHQMREIALRSNHRLPWEQQHQQDEQRFFHFSRESVSLGRES